MQAVRLLKPKRPEAVAAYVLRVRRAKVYRLKHIWRAIKQRCDDKDNKYYAGRGISYSQEWNSFEIFYADMESTYRAGLQLDRIDPDGNYCKENCHWMTKQDHCVKSALERSGKWPRKTWLELDRMFSI